MTNKDLILRYFRSWQEKDWDTMRASLIDHPEFSLGMRFKSDAVTVSKEDIIRFASEYDPQPFHLDEEAAKTSILGGLAASGWHTAAIAMRLAASARPFGPHPLFGAGNTTT